MYLFFIKQQVRKDPALAKVGIAACKIQTTSAPTDVRRETIEILNRILPPKEWEEDGQIWTQRVNLNKFLRQLMYFFNYTMCSNPQMMLYYLGVEYSRNKIRCDKFTRATRYAIATKTGERNWYLSCS